MNKFRSVLLTYFFHKFITPFNFISANPIDTDKNQYELIDVYLNNFNPKDFIIKKPNCANAVQITPINNKIINSINIYNEKVWNKRETSHCKSFTIYFNIDDKFIIILNTIEHEQKRIYHISFNERSNYMDIIPTLYSLNPALYTENISRRDKLDIFDRFDKFYYNHSHRQKDDRTLDIYKPIKNDKFIYVSDKYIGIWSAENETNKEVGCINVELYTKANEFKFIRLTLDDGNINYYKYDLVNKFWKDITEEEFHGSVYVAFLFIELDETTIIKQSVSGFYSGNRNPDLVIDISKKSNRFKNTTRNIAGDHYISFIINQKYPIELIKYNGQVLFVGNLKLFSITMIKTKNNDHLIQLTYPSVFQKLHIYHFALSGDDKWIRIYQEDFIDIVQDTIGESKLLCYCNVDLYGIKNGYVVDDFTPKIKDLIAKHTEPLINLDGQHVSNEESTPTEIVQVNNEQAITEVVQTTEPTESLPNINIGDPEVKPPEIQNNDQLKKQETTEEEQRSADSCVNLSSDINLIDLGTKSQPPINSVEIDNEQKSKPTQVLPELTSEQVGDKPIIETPIQPNTIIPNYEDTETFPEDDSYNSKPKLVVPTSEENISFKSKSFPDFKTITHIELSTKEISPEEVVQVKKILRNRSSFITNILIIPIFTTFSYMF